MIITAHDVRQFAQHRSFTSKEMEEHRLALMTDEGDNKVVEQRMKDFASFYNHVFFLGDAERVKGRLQSVLQLKPQKLNQADQQTPANQSKIVNDLRSYIVDECNCQLEIGKESSNALEGFYRWCGPNRNYREHIETAGGLYKFLVQGEAAKQKLLIEPGPERTRWA